MARRSKRRSVRGKPNYVWVAAAGEIALVPGNSCYDPILIPSDWSPTVTDGRATLLRLVLSVYTYTIDGVGIAHAQNAAITMGNASEGSGMTTHDLSNYNEWPDFFESYDRVLRIFRLEWDGVNRSTDVVLPVQFSQLPEPVMNLKTPRRLEGDDSIRLWSGASFIQSIGETPVVAWFSRALVRVGLQ